MVQIVLGGAAQAPFYSTVGTAGHGRCSHCQGVKQRKDAALCEQCQLSLPSEVLKAYEAQGLAPSYANGGVIPVSPTGPGGIVGLGGFIGMGSHVSVGTRRHPGGSSPGRIFYDPVGHPPVPLEDVDPDRAPDLMEYVLAWRGWNTTPDGHLVAAAQDGIWDPGQNKAICIRQSHTDVPSERCQCGFYGWHYSTDIAHGSIWGALKCHGEIIVHDVGIRAEYAEIVVVLNKGDEDPEMLARIVDRYKVPVVDTLEEAEKIADEHGVRVPESMRPKRPDIHTPTDVSALMVQMLSQGFSAAETLQRAKITTGKSMAELVEAFQAVGQSSAAAMAQMANMLAPPGIVAPANVAPGLAPFTGQIVGDSKPRPAGRSRIALEIVMFLVLDGLWGLLAGIVSAASWLGLVYGAAVGITCFFTSAPDKVWRFGRAVRCSVHSSHMGLWKYPPAVVDRGGVMGNRPIWSRHVPRGERCTYCGRKSRSL